MDSSNQSNCSCDCYLNNENSENYSDYYENSSNDTEVIVKNNNSFFKNSSMEYFVPFIKEKNHYQFLHMNCAIRIDSLECPSNWHPFFISILLNNNSYRKKRIFKGNTKVITQSFLAWNRFTLLFRENNEIFV